MKFIITEYVSDDCEYRIRKDRYGLEPWTVYNKYGEEEVGRYATAQDAMSVIVAGRKSKENSESVKSLDAWFNAQDFKTMERMTGYSQGDFDPEDGYQEFVDACESWWDQLSTIEKIGYYKTYGGE